ncbi:MAG: nucleotidyl transferase AbiEii/AbiGii toxin family protein, partial [Nanoarchaeota archaeon]
KKSNFVVIGGYAVNAYTLPRFSVDCDIVIKDREELEKIGEALLEMGYHKERNYSDEIPYDGNFERYEKELGNNFKVSIDILIGEVFDRQTKAKFSADWVFDNSSLRNLQGKTISEQLKLKIINADALFTMKLICCRQTDIRDIFLLINSVKDKKWVKKEISERYDLKDRLSKALSKINSKQFKDELQGVFGMVDDRIFERNKKLISELGLK